MMPDATTPATAAIYAAVHQSRTGDHIALALARLRARVDRLVVVVSPSMAMDFAALLAGCAADELIEVAEATTLLAGYRAGLENLADMSFAGNVVLTGSHVFGPVLRGEAGTLEDILPGATSMARDGVSVLSSYWHVPSVDPRLIRRTELPRIASLDFAIVSDALRTDPLWREVMERDYPNSREGMLALAERLAKAGHRVAYPCADTTYEVAEPEIFEVHKLIAAGSPCLPIATLMLDPLLHDLGAINMRRAIDDLRRLDPVLYATTIRFATANMALRDFATIADQYEVLPEVATAPAPRPRSFGAIAVFIHAFYADMMPEFWTLIERLPGDSHLFLTTADEAGRDGIAAFLKDKGFAPDRVIIRVVEQNRGRDMASLFITWRDIVLSGDYPVALRLHSKRTPQVPRQVGENFKHHLFDNLAATSGYVSNVLDMMEANDDIGLVVPPVVHMGFGSLGHSWHNNRAGALVMLERMGINLTLDKHTPTAPYGTMFWFRTEALRDMFEIDWAWEDYNAEPHHVDGGLAHIQERLIGYCAQHRGFRTVSIMTPRHAARGYARLEYKLQLLAAYLPTGNIIEQKYQMESLGVGQFRLDLYGRLIKFYGALIGRFPSVRKYIARPGRALGRWLLSDPSAHR